jgi:hypothetical protein
MPRPILALTLVVILPTFVSLNGIILLVVRISMSEEVCNDVNFVVQSAQVCMELHITPLYTPAQLVPYLHRIALGPNRVPEQYKKGIPYYGC